MENNFHVSSDFETHRLQLYLNNWRRSRDEKTCLFYDHVKYLINKVLHTCTRLFKNIFELSLRVKYCTFAQ